MALIHNYFNLQLRIGNDHGTASFKQFNIAFLIFSECSYPKL